MKEGLSARGERELAGRDDNRKLEEFVHLVEKVGRAFCSKEQHEQKLRDGVPGIR